MFGNHFTKERLQYGLYGLYPKYRTYIEPLTTLLGMIGHALIVATLQNDRGTLSDKCKYFINKLKHGLLFLDNDKLMLPFSFVINSKYLERDNINPLM